MTKHLTRFEGRLFTEGGCLFLVVSADESQNLARVTCRVGDRTEVIEMPLSEVARRISASPGLMLDNLNGHAADRRIFSRDDGWYLSTREGRIGPYGAREDAARELVRYVLTMQEGCDTPPLPLGSTGSRRTDSQALRPRSAPPAENVERSATTGRLRG